MNICEQLKNFKKPIISIRIFRYCFMMIFEINIDKNYFKNYTKCCKPDIYSKLRTNNQQKFPYCMAFKYDNFFNAYN